MKYGFSFIYCNTLHLHPFRVFQMAGMQHDNSQFPHLVLPTGLGYPQLVDTLVVNPDNNAYIHILSTMSRGNGISVLAMIFCDPEDGTPHKRQAVLIPSYGFPEESKSTADQRKKHRELIQARLMNGCLDLRDRAK